MKILHSNARKNIFMFQKVSKNTCDLTFLTIFRGQMEYPNMGNTHFCVATFCQFGRDLGSSSYEIDEQGEFIYTFFGIL